MTEFQKRFRRIATEFLRTAIVFDDKAYSNAVRIDTALRPPPLRRSYRTGGTESPGGDLVSDDLDTVRLVGGFAEHGILCGVPGMEGVGGTMVVDELMDHADIVVLDWQMRGDDGTFALDRLRHLTNDTSRLRIVAVYTGEAELDKVADLIKSSVATELNWGGSPSHMLWNGSCYVALYCKEGTNPRSDFANRVVSEEDLADRMVGDFVTIVAGLLPAVVLTALTSVRDNAYRLLNSFGERLDPAFLSHRSGLQTPDDAEALVARMISGEIEEIVEEAVATHQPAGLDAIDKWLGTTGLGETVRTDVRELLATGDGGTVQLLSAELREKSPKKSHIWLAGELSSDSDPARVNYEFAWLASHRAVARTGPKRLHLGTIVRKGCSESGVYYVCVRPRCDSVRLENDTPFLFLVLARDGGKRKLDEGRLRLVIRTNTGFIVRFVSSEPFLCKFAATAETGVVQTQVIKGEEQQFVDTDKTAFTWVGELRQEFAQRIAQSFGSHLARVAAEDSEWLRRMARGG